VEHLVGKQEGVFARNEVQQEITRGPVGISPFERTRIVVSVARNPINPLPNPGVARILLATDIILEFSFFFTTAGR
jgi:hypothetical protein